MAAGPQSAYAQAPVSAPAGMNLSPGMIGVIAAVKGQVELVSSQQVGRIAGSGAPIFLGDVIKTDAEGHLQILLLDQTVFTIGQNSSLVIDEFVYDPATHDGKIDVRILEGAFRYISGRIPTHKPDNVDIKLPSGSVGIRGTILYGNVQGDHSKLLLLGPGENNNTSHRRGRIMVSNDVDGQKVTEEIKKSGFGSEIEGENIPPRPAYAFSEQEIKEMIEPFTTQASDKEKEDGSAPKADAPRRQAAKNTAADGQDEKKVNNKDAGKRAESGGKEQTRGPSQRNASEKADSTTTDPDGRVDGKTAATTDATRTDDTFTRDSSALDFEGTVTDVSGQKDAETRTDIDLKFDRDSFVSDFDDKTEESSRDIIDTTLGALDGISQISDLITYQAGKVTYHASSVAMGLGGTFSASIEVDFDNQKIGGGSSNVSYTAGSSGIGMDGSSSLNAINYGSSSGAATFEFLISDSSLCGTGCSGDLDVALNTKNGNVADNANIKLTVDDTYQRQSGETTVPGTTT